MVERIDFLDDFDPTPRLTRLGSAVVHFFDFIPNLGITHGDNFKNTGGGPALDAALEAHDGGNEPTL